MEEKEVSRRNNSFWSIFGSWNACFSFFGRKDRHNRLYKSTAGFTLVELLVIIVILGLLAVVAIAVLNPAKQLDRAKDAQRLSDLEQIRNALSTYYNDHNAYPAVLPTGVYMENVPLDPDTNKPFPYETDSSSNPQWAVVYAKLSALTASCLLTKLSNCLPQNFTSSWSCLVLGNINTSACTSIESQSLPSLP